MSPPALHRSLPWLAAAGLLGGHAVSTWLVGASSDAAGVHGYLDGAVQVGVIAAVVGLTALVTGRIVRVDRSLPATGALIARLATLQVVALIVMETGERLAAGATLADLAWVLPVGALVQVGVAAALGLALGGVLRATARVIAGAIAAPTRRPRLTWTIGDVARPAPMPAVATAGARAPPP